MKRRDLIRHLSDHGCVLVREGHSHTIYESHGTVAGCRYHVTVKLLNPLCAPFAANLRYLHRDCWTKIVVIAAVPNGVIDGRGQRWGEGSAGDTPAALGTAAALGTQQHPLPNTPGFL